MDIDAVLKSLFRLKDNELTLVKAVAQGTEEAARVVKEMIYGASKQVHKVGQPKSKANSLPVYVYKLPFERHG